ncbi:MAG: lipopolysaccharide biosynthesis protein [Bacteroidota bacterium]
MLLGAVNLGMRGVSVVSTIVLARILEPSDFGLVAMALILLQTSSLFSGLGMRQALVQTKLPVHIAASHAIVVTSFAGLFFSSLVFLNAQWFAVLLGNQGVAPMLQWMSPIIFIQSISLVPEALLQRELQFVRMSLAMIIPELPYVGVAIGLAFLGFGAWSLVYASLVRVVVRGVLQVFMCADRGWLIPKDLNRATFILLLRFGMQTTGSGLVSFFNSIMDNLIVGRFLGVQALGYYSKAYDFSTHTVDGFNRVISGVLFPSYSKIQDDRDRLLRAYLKTLSIISLVTVPACLGLCILAPEIIGTLFGTKWLPMVTAFRILCIMCLVRSLSATTSPLFLSLGKPHLDLRAGTLVLVIMVGLMFSLLTWGIDGIAMAMLISQTIGFVYNLSQVHQIFSGAAWRMIVVLRPSILSGLAMVTGIFIVRMALQSVLHDALILLIVLVAIGAMVFLGMIQLVQRSLLAEMRDLVRSALARKKPATIPETSEQNTQHV